ncbi:MAG TPA: alpha/beta hydrolase-fold protein [Gemmatimonadaceae bacterium]|nr:alpha/beta hydrolase-fold protein [Gemmatimonadaceae bacterium]
MTTWTREAALAGLLTVAMLTTAAAQAPAARPRRVQDTLTSPVVGADGAVTFRLFAPKATAVLVRSEGPAPFADQPLVKGDSGVWSLTAKVPADLYIYWYDVDGVAVADPRNNRPRVNMSTVRSLLEVPGAASEFFAERAVPHGQVAAVHYQSQALGVPRRMHVYTPPGYATSGQRYPVFYLLHGGGDNDLSWLMAGRANFILDNLIAAGKAKPMIVVMPAGHTPPSRGGTPAPDAFARDLMTDVVPYVERNYRTLPGREHRAIAGLSMGGQQTLNVGLTNLDKFSQLGVFSSGWFGQDGAATFARNNPTLLADPKLNDRIRLFWLATGKDDFVMPSTKASLAMLDQHKVRYSYKETEGGHTWPNWRAYLNEFAPLLFR